MRFEAAATSPSAEPPQPTARAASWHPATSAGRPRRDSGARSLPSPPSAARSKDVIRTRIYLASGSDWRPAVEAHRELFSAVNPANTTVFVTGFPPEGVLVEVEVDAVVPD